MARPDLDKIFDTALRFAQQQLAAHGEYFPFGVAMNVDGAMHMCSAHADEERPLSQKVIDTLVAGLKGEAAEGAIRAAGICLDMRTIPPGATEKTDVICVWLEHADGEAVDVALPYRKATSGGYDYGTIYAGRGGHGIFGRSR